VHTHKKGKILPVLLDDREIKDSESNINPYPAKGKIW